MIKIIGVNFRNVGKVYYFDPKDLVCRLGDHVIVETSRGKEYGKVVLGPTMLEDSQVKLPLREVCRMATPEDDRHAEENRQKEREAYRICVKKIREHELDMKLIDVEYGFDNNKILFYFTADGRVDFRLLVKDLAAVFKTRIELRQIGVRDETKILGGIGICGRTLCCHTWLTDFVPVSIRMAKEQNLSLNQTKISGVCGRLMCCLKNEQETYEELNSRLPFQGDNVMLPDGRSGVVHSVNVLRQTVKVTVEENDEKEVLEFAVEELNFRPRKKKGKAGKEAKGQNKENKDNIAGLTEKQGEAGKDNTREKPSRQDKESRRHTEKKPSAEKTEEEKSDKIPAEQKKKEHRKRRSDRRRNSRNKKEMPEKNESGAGKVE